MHLLQRLRDATRPHHQRTEARFDVMREDLTLDHYRRLLGCCYGFYAPVEARLSAAAFADLPLSGRLKTPMLRLDLEALAVGEAGVGHCATLPDVSSPERAWGCLYVLEGATLGGQIITRHVRRTLRLTPRRGCAFFHSYGDRVGEMWRDFGRRLSAAEVRSADEVVRGARETFDCFYGWLGRSARAPQ
jgi:heme oxygenase